MAYSYAADAQGVAHGSHSSSRKDSGQDADILREFKRKLAEEESYIAYFNDRIRIEQSYIDQLQRLHAKTVGSDSLQDDVTSKTGKSTARRAWFEVRDYTQREIESREALVHALQSDVIAGLVSVRDTQTRIRNRIQEDLKNATDTYKEYAFFKVPKLSRVYQNKCQTLEDFKKQEHAIAMQQKLLSEPSPSGSPQSDKPHPFALSPPTSTSPKPPANTNQSIYAGYPASSLVPEAAHTQTSLATSPPPASNTSPTGMPTSASYTPLPPPQRLDRAHGRARSGSASHLASAVDARSKEVLSDLAAQSKKGFSAIRQRFGGEHAAETTPASSASDEVRSPTPHRRLPSSGSVRGGNALKSVKVKREADEADQAYREGVFHVESLRLRREKFQQSALTSLEQFNEEQNVTLLRSLRAFTDAVHGTAATLAQSTEVITTSISEVNPQCDRMLFNSRLPVLRIMPPVLYDNFYVGPCRSLIFGVSLTDYDFARGEGGDRGSPPVIVDKCVQAIESRGIDFEGIYRISGRQATVKQMIQDIERDEDSFQFTTEDDVFSIGVILKRYLRELPEPLFPLPHAERVKHSENRETHISSSFTSLRSRLRRLPPIHQTSFQTIVEHLTRIAFHSASNKMDAKNLAVVFNSVLFGQDQVTGSSNALTQHLEKDTVLEDMITYSDLLFGPEKNVVPMDKQAMEDAREASEPLPSMAEEQVAPAYEKEPSPVEPSRLTPDSSLELLFDPVVIPASMRAAVGDDFHVRPLASDDFLRSHFGLLATLSKSPALAPSVYGSLFSTLKSSSDTYYIVAVVDKTSDQIAAAGTVIVERKFSHGGGLAGHIEDIVVSPNAQGRRLGLNLVVGLRDLATVLGCYKTILDCQEVKMGFYEKCGFKLRGRQMAYYVPETDLVSPPGSIPKSSPGVFDATSAGEVVDTSHETESIAETVETASDITYHFPTTNESSDSLTPAHA